MSPIVARTPVAYVASPPALAGRAVPLRIPRRCFPPSHVAAQSNFDLA